MKKTFFACSLLLALSATALHATAQAPKPRASPADSVTGKVGDATLTIRYSSPSVKGRKIWGALVPYGKAWRAGANEATTFETDKAITVEGKPLPAGKYSLFAVPGEKEWQFIFNSQTGQWGIKRTGEANFDPANTALTVSVMPAAAPAASERLQYQLTPAGFVLKWENLLVPVSVK